jgi:CRISPR-associated protein Cmr2
MTEIYTAISFAPVQGFIEKSRKLRDLYGASQILSYLSQRLIQKIQSPDHSLELIQPNIKLLTSPTINVERGIPNRILFKGYIKRDVVKLLLRDSWFEVLNTCRKWIETQIPGQYYWGEEWGVRWRDNTWELFWGKGHNPQAANDDLETRKLKRDWIAINWTGESSSITGTDAIAWPRLGDPSIKPDRPLNQTEKTQLAEFYLQLARRSENRQDPEGKFIDTKERLSIPELVKRLINLEEIAESLKIPTLPDKLTALQRKPEDKNGKLLPGQWTGWFVGDGDKMGNYLKSVYSTLGDEGLKDVSEKLLDWGKDFQETFPTSQPAPENWFGQVIYAGGDDFLGLIYSRNFKKPIPAYSAFEWLRSFSSRWNEHGLHEIQDYPEEGKCCSPSVSAGFVWAGHSVPQRDVLQHCREAEKRAKSLGRNRVTIRVVFNNGQYIQWTCPWEKLSIFEQYSDRDGKTGKKANWSHIYNDWAQLKSRHAIRLIETEKQRITVDLAIKILDLYFNNAGTQITEASDLDRPWEYIAGDDKPVSIVNWINDLINVGWQLQYVRVPD